MTIFPPCLLVFPFSRFRALAHKEKKKKKGHPIFLLSGSVSVCRTSPLTSAFPLLFEFPRTEKKPIDLDSGSSQKCKGGHLLSRLLFLGKQRGINLLLGTTHDRPPLAYERQSGNAGGDFDARLNKGRERREEERNKKVAGNLISDFA